MRNLSPTVTILKHSRIISKENLHQYTIYQATHNTHTPAPLSVTQAIHLLTNTGSKQQPEVTKLHNIPKAKPSASVKALEAQQDPEVIKPDVRRSSRDRKVKVQ